MRTGFSKYPLISSLFVIASEYSQYQYPCYSREYVTISFSLKTNNYRTNNHNLEASLRIFISSSVLYMGER